MKSCGRFNVYLRLLNLLGGGVFNDQGNILGCYRGRESALPTTGDAIAPLFEASRANERLLIAEAIVALPLLWNMIQYEPISMPLWYILYDYDSSKAAPAVHPTSP